MRTQFRNERLELFDADDKTVISKADVINSAKFHRQSDHFTSDYLLYARNKLLDSRDWSFRKCLTLYRFFSKNFAKNIQSSSET